MSWPKQAGSTLPCEPRTVTALFHHLRPNLATNGPRADDGPENSVLIKGISIQATGIEGDVCGGRPRTSSVAAANHRARPHLGQLPPSLGVVRKIRVKIPEALLQAGMQSAAVRGFRRPAHSALRVALRGSPKADDDDYERWHARAERIPGEMLGSGVSGSMPSLCSQRTACTHAGCSGCVTPLASLVTADPPTESTPGSMSGRRAQPTCCDTHRTRQTDLRELLHPCCYKRQRQGQPRLALPSSRHRASKHSSQWQSPWYTQPISCGAVKMLQYQGGQKGQ